MEVRLRASVLCMREGKLLVVCLKDPVSGQKYRFPPGGQIEKGESPKEAAVREAVEETGYRVTLVDSPPLVVDYPFVWASKVVACRTVFFQAVVQGDPRPVSGREKVVEGFEWVEPSILLPEWSGHPELQKALKHLAEPLPKHATEKNPKPNRKKA